MIVYMVSAGSYSDYGIVGLFSDEERANRFVELGFGDDVVPMEIDDPDMIEQSKQAVSLWRIDAYYNTVWERGKETGRSQWFFTANPAYGEETPITFGARHSYVNRPEYHGTVWAKSRDHAEKVAQDIVYQKEAERLELT